MITPSLTVADIKAALRISRTPTLNIGNRRTLDRLGAFFWAITVGDWAFLGDVAANCDLLSDQRSTPPFRDSPRSVLESKRPPPSACVYFVQSGSIGPIKIGYSEDPPRRLSGLVTMSPERLHLLGTIPANEGTEGRLHKRFAGFRLHGEWFRPADELLEFIRRRAK